MTATIFRCFLRFLTKTDQLSYEEVLQCNKMYTVDLKRFGADCLSICAIKGFVTREILASDNEREESVVQYLCRFVGEIATSA